MRPKSIIMFQWVYLAFIIVSALETALNWDAMVETAVMSTPEIAPVVTPVFAGTTAISFAISVLLWWLTAWKRSQVAKWIVVVFFGLVVLSFLIALATVPVTMELAKLANLVALVLNGVAVWYLFRPDAAQWFGAKEAPTLASKTFE
jgi:hypothetical protein